MIFPCLIENLKQELKSLKKMNSSKNMRPLKRDSAVMSFVESQKPKKPVKTVGEMYNEIKRNEFKSASENGNLYR